MSDPKAVVKLLRRRDIDIQAARQAGYLGIDLGGGRRAARAARASRVVKAKAPSKRLRGHAFASKCYLATERALIAGPQASAACVHQVHGIFGTELRNMRRQVGAVAGTPRGRCSTTLLDLRAFGQDPAVTLLSFCLMQWLDTWVRHRETRNGIRQIWSRLVAAIKD
eukprot:6388048-Pyramimonas_sp.AAC.2